MKTVTQILMELCDKEEARLNAQKDANASAVTENAIDKLPVENQAGKRDKRQNRFVEKCDCVGRVQS